MTENAKEAILNLSHGSSFSFMNTDNSGYEVYRLYHLYVLFEISKYDEKPIYRGLYKKIFIIAAIDTLNKQGECYEMVIEKEKGY